jgi:hypothetical protein
LDELERREAAARAEAEELRGRIAELTERLAGAEERLARLVITRETVNEVLAAAGPEASPVPTAEQPVRAVPAVPGRSPVIGVVKVPPWRAGLDVSVLPRESQAPKPSSPCAPSSATATSATTGTTTSTESTSGSTPAPPRASTHSAPNPHARQLHPKGFAGGEGGRSWVVTETATGRTGMTGCQRTSPPRALTLQAVKEGGRI